VNEGLGAWEDVPARNFEADVTGVQLDNREVFVLTRVDGQMTVDDLCSVSGFSNAETVQALLTLLRHNLLVIQRAEGDRNLVRNGPKPEEQPADLGGRKVEPARPARAAVEPRERVEYPPFTGVDPADAAWLQDKGAYGFVPGRPYADPGAGRYGPFTFDRRELLKKSALSVALRKEVVFLSASLGKLDHFEFFGIAPTSDRKVLKKAYFLFSKRFHPDSYFRKDPGLFKERIEQIYRYGTQVYEKLQEHEELRTRYERAVTARNKTFRDRLEDERAARDRQQMVSARQKSSGRKTALKARLERNQRTRRDNNVTQAVDSRLQRAERFYNEGMELYQNESFIAAANSLRLAMSYDPRNESYQQAFERVSSKAAQVRADLLWKRGYMEESVGRMKEAVAAYLEAVEIYPRGDYCGHVAELMLSWDDDLHHAAKLARIACDADPQNLDYLLVLGKIYIAANLGKKAIAALERALKIDPKRDEVKKAMKAAKRL
jgi:tetratricopeptide (TPR) repeat protein